MNITRFDWDGSEAAKLAAEIRALQPPLEEVSEAVAEIVSAVKSEGDAAVLHFEERFGGGAPKELRVPEDVRAVAMRSVFSDNPSLHDAIEVAVSNVRAVAEAEAQAETKSEVELGAGQTVSHRSVPVTAAGAYVPGGAAPYPSTAIMCCVPARVAEVRRVVMASPAGPGGAPDPLVLAASSAAGTDDVYAMGGAQAIAALALGTETVDRVDVVVGPGNRFVQEAKRQLYGKVGVDGIAGPSELMTILESGAFAAWAAFDLCAQAEHGGDGLLVAATPERGALRALQGALDVLLKRYPNIGDAPLALVQVPSLEAAGELADALAPEHLELLGPRTEVLAHSVRTAGCVFNGAYAGTAFGDFAAGSNHVLPTGGSGRFAGPLGVRHFRRRLATVRLTESAVAELAPTVATLARAEGFPVHAESAEARAEGGEAR